MHAGNMPAGATKMVAVPFALSCPSDRFRVEVGSASILLALVGMLPTIGFDLCSESARANKSGARNVYAWMR
jgi:hypothetical protein